MINLKNSTYTYIDSNYNLFILQRDKLAVLMDKLPNDIKSNDWKIIIEII